MGNVVGIVEPVGGHGGMDYYDYGLALGLGNNNIEVRYYTCSETNIRSYGNVTTIICFEKMWKKGIIAKSVKYLNGHLKAFVDLKKNQAKVVHMHFFTFRTIDVLVIAMAKLFGLTAIGTVHDVNSFDKKSSIIIEQICYKLLNGIIVHNKTSCDILQRKQTVNKNISIIPHGNYLPFISPVDGKRETSGPFTILFFGQIKKVKGVDVLLRSIYNVKKRGHTVKLIIAGRAWKDDLSEYLNLINSLDLGDIVETDFRYIPDEEVASFYDRSDLVVLPYKEIYQSGVLLLAMSYGKPVLCSDLPAFREIVEHGETGYLFRSEDSDDLASQIIYLLTSRNDLNTDKARKLIAEKFDWTQIGTLTKNFYDKTIMNSPLIA